MNWILAPNLNAAIVGYGGRHLSGPRHVVQFFPTGATKGRLVEQLKSMVLIGGPGLQCILCTRIGDGWEHGSWRCLTLTPGHMFRNEKGQNGVRVPDLDLLDLPMSKRAKTDPEESFTLVKAFADGKDWTFGSLADGSLHNKVRQIILRQI